jgi:hypothetical protein
MGFKNLIGSVLIILLMFFFLAADLEAMAPRTLGFKVGYTSGQLRAVETGDDIQVKKFATGGLTLGLVSNLKLTSWLYFQPEFIYFQKGGKYEVDVPLPVSIPGFQVYVVDTRHLDYLEIPLLMKVSLPLQWKLKPTFITGVSAGIKLSGQLVNEVNVRIGGYNFLWPKTEDITRQLNNIELSYIIGGGFDLEIGRSTLALDQRFSFGFKTNKYETVIPASYFQVIGIPVPQDIVYRLKMYNYVFSVALTYFF